MKKNIEVNTKKELTNNKGEIITRADALKKVGYIAVSAATMMILLSNPNNAKADTGSPTPPGNF